jgi:hypothetical protein
MIASTEVELGTSHLQSVIWASMECVENRFIFYFYYESRKRDLKTRLTYEDRYDERLKNISLTELVNVCQVGFREPIHLCTCVNEEGVNGEGVGSETSSLMSYTLRYVSLSDLVNVCQVGF